MPTNQAAHTTSEHPAVNESRPSRSQLLKTVLVRFGAGMLALGVLFFLPAGTLRYWEAWAWLATLCVPMIGVLIYLILKDPELLERRLRFREKETTQKRVIGFSWIWLLATFILPGLDHRFGWSHVPLAIVIASDVCVFLGYLLFIVVMRANSYASRVVEVQEGQKVISTGPYAWVRHPLYSSSLIIYGFSATALGSYWALIPALMIVPILVVRALNEEKVLRQGLPGYVEYTQKIRYRLVPGVW